jgi:hypothetical protein
MNIGMYFSCKFTAKGLLFRLLKQLIQSSRLNVYTEEEAQKFIEDYERKLEDII